MPRITVLAAHTFGLAAIVSADVYLNPDYGNMFYLSPSTGDHYITKYPERAATVVFASGCPLFTGCVAFLRTSQEL